MIERLLWIAVFLTLAFPATIVALFIALLTDPVVGVAVLFFELGAIAYFLGEVARHGKTRE